MRIGESLRQSFESLKANKARSFLTGLGMVIGTGSVILVVTISLTSQSYILEQIEGVGSNMIFASYEVGSQQADAQVDADFIKINDVDRVRTELADEIVAATPIMNNIDRMTIQGKEQDVLIVGSDQYYQPVRNLLVLAGRFMDGSDVALRRKVALLTEKFATRLYGGNRQRSGASSRSTACNSPSSGRLRKRFPVSGNRN